MIIDRTDEQQNPQISTAVICRATVWMLFAEPIWASGHGAAQIEAGHMTAFEPTSDFANLNLNSRGRPHMIFVDLENSQRYALHIENKTAHSKWEPDQAKNYRKRAMNRMKPLRYADFQTVLVAPASFIDKHPTEAARAVQPSELMVH